MRNIHISRVWEATVNRSLIVILALVVLIVLPLDTAKADTNIEIDDFVFTQSYSGRIILKEYKGYSMYLQIPQTVMGYQVDEIGDYAFNFEYSIWEVTIPGGVSSIGFWAFKSCSNLRKVYVPGSVTYIGSSAFDNCPKLVLYGPDGSYVQRYSELNSIPFVRYPVPTETPTPDPFLPGDANNDGGIDIMDLVSIIDYIVSDTSPASMPNADANGDGTVDIMDLVWIIDRIVNS